MGQPSFVAQVASPDTCRHCSSPLTRSDVDGFCCRGCREVYQLVQDAGFGRYYELGGGKGHPIVRGESDHKWLEPLAASVANAPAITTVTLDVQGVHCSACVWILEKVFSKQTGGARILVNPAIGSVELAVDRRFSLERFVENVEAFGYRFGPPLKDGEKASSDLVWRMGVTIAIAMNTMIFGIAIYCGLESGPVFRLFHGLDFGLSFVSVLIGGSVFFGRHGSPSGNVHSTWICRSRSASCSCF
jgi:Cu2+-exporting ATPase